MKYLITTLTLLIGSIVGFEVSTFNMEEAVNKAKINSPYKCLFVEVTDDPNSTQGCE